MKLNILSYYLNQSSELTWLFYGSSTRIVLCVWKNSQHMCCCFLRALSCTLASQWEMLGTFVSLESWSQDSHPVPSCHQAASLCVFTKKSSTTEKLIMISLWQEKELFKDEALLCSFNNINNFYQPLIVWVISTVNWLEVGGLIRHKQT